MQQTAPQTSTQHASRRTKLIPISLLPVVCCVLMNSSCAYAPLRTPATTPLPLPDALRTYYDYPKQTPSAVIQLLHETPTHREYLVRFPLIAPDFQPTEPIVEFEWFESTTPGRHPAILFNPILGGDYPLERGICQHLVRHGFQVALVHRKTLKISPQQPVGSIELLLRQGIVRIRQVVDWMAARETVDPARLGSFGVSMGGIASVITAAVEPRLRCHFIALAGGSIPDILMSSNDRLLAKPRSNYLAANHMDLATMDRQLRQVIQTDPMRFAPYVDARHLFLVIALADRTIGRANALRLWRALGRPQATFLPFGHYSTYLTLPYLNYLSLRFFRAQLISPSS